MISAMLTFSVGQKNILRDFRHVLEQCLYPASPNMPGNVQLTFIFRIKTVSCDWLSLKGNSFLSHKLGLLLQFVVIK